MYKLARLLAICMNTLRLKERRPPVGAAAIDAI
jgi:hypothetical protein